MAIPTVNAAAANRNKVLNSRNHLESPSVQHASKSPRKAILLHLETSTQIASHTFT